MAPSKIRFNIPKKKTGILKYILDKLDKIRLQAWIWHNIIDLQSQLGEK